MGYLDTFYARPPPSSTPCARKERLWYIHFLLLLAFGKAFTSRKDRGRRPPGAEFFTRAIELLPSTVTLSREPIMSVEILMCLALYIHCIDYRMSAYNYVSLHIFREDAVTDHSWQIGQAIRLAMCNGMHGYVSPDQVGQDVAQRYQKIWSTVYVLDCEMTSWQGLPPSVSSEDVCTLLPTSLDDPGLASALTIRVKLSRVISRVNKCKRSFVNFVFLFMTDTFLPQQFTVRMGAWMADFSCGPRKHCRGLQSLPTHFSENSLLFSTIKPPESPGHPLTFICYIIRYVC